MWKYLFAGVFVLLLTATDAHALAPVLAVISIGGLINLLLYLIVIGIILWLVLWVISEIPLPAPFGQIARVVVIVIAALILVLLLLQLVQGTGPPLIVG